MPPPEISCYVGLGRDRVATDCEQVEVLADASNDALYAGLPSMIIIIGLLIFFLVVAYCAYRGAILVEGKQDQAQFLIKEPIS